MTEKQMKYKGLVTGCIAPAVWLLLMIGHWSGLWSKAPDTSWMTTYIVILMVLMLVGAAAPLWWLMTAYRRRNTLQEKPVFLIGLNLLALAISILYFF